MKILPLSISYCSKANKDNKINNIISHSPSFYGNFPPVCYYPPAGIKSGSFSPKDFLEDIKYDNSEAFLRNTETGKEELQPNTPAIKKLKALDNLTLLEKKAFVNEFCAMTGFPNFKKVKENMESEFKGALLSLGENEGFKTLFIGYDKNCSLGRGQAFPGSDADALFAIIDDRHQPYSWYAGKIRWDVKDIINQRILCTHAGGLPEVLSINFINQGLDMADCAFKKADFSEEDLKRFGTNLKNDSNDFVSAAEFNIRMAKQLPKRGDIRDTFYKTAMLVELLRDGIILENSFDKETIQKIKNSPLYKYSNIVRQQGLSEKIKPKLKEREKLSKEFSTYPIEKQFSVVYDILRASYLLEPKNKENEKYFTNTNSNGEDIMGNILEMYQRLLNDW